MPAQREDLVIEQGATFIKNIKWMESDEVTPVDLTNYTARMHVRSDVESDVILVNLVSPTNITLGGAAGTIVITIDATTTAGYAFTEGVYDLELVDGSGVVTRLIYGGVEVTPEVTR